MRHKGLTLSAAALALFFLSWARAGAGPIDSALDASGRWLLEGRIASNTSARIHLLWQIMTPAAEPAPGVAELDLSDPTRPAISAMVANTVVSTFVMVDRGARFRFGQPEIVLKGGELFTTSHANGNLFYLSLRTAYVLQNDQVVGPRSLSAAAGNFVEDTNSEFTDATSDPVDADDDLFLVTTGADADPLFLMSFALTDSNSGARVVWTAIPESQVPASEPASLPLLLIALLPIAARWLHRLPPIART